MKKGILFVLCFFIFSHLLFSDESRYNNTIIFTIESENYIIKHHHNWVANFAYIECINKTTNSIIFNVSTPALTKLFISDDEKYIIGLSNIKVDNPYQIIILDIDGEYILKRHISTLESRLTQNNYLTFIEKYPEEYNNLKSMNRICNAGEYYFIDFFNCNQFLRNDARNYLLEHLSKNHLSNNFAETVTNFIIWYNESNTELEYIYNDNNELTAISLLDRKNERILININ